MPFSFTRLLFSTVWRPRSSRGRRGLQPSSLFVSVGHTAHSQVNSGIQRVTRSIAREVLARYPKSDLLEWYLEKGRYILLDETARAKFACYSGPTYERIEDLLLEEREALLAPLETKEESGWDRLCALIVTEESQSKFRRGAGWRDRVKMALLLRWVDRCRRRLPDLERGQRVDETAYAAEIKSRVERLRVQWEDALRALREEGGNISGKDESSSERVIHYWSRAEEEMLQPIAADPFASGVLARLQTDELTQRFANLVGSLDRSGFRPLRWVSFLPAPRAVRRKLRWCIRRFDNIRQEAADRNLIKRFIKELVGIRLVLDRFRSRHQKRLDLQSEREMDLFSGLSEIQLMQGDDSATELNESLRRSFARIQILRRRLYPRAFLPPEGSWVLIPELMTSEELRDVLSFARKRGLKVAIVFHDALPVQFPDLVSARFREDHENYMRVIAQADCLLPVSEYSRKCYEEWATKTGVAIPRIEVCLNGVKFRDRTSGSGNIEVPKAVMSDFILCVSTVEPRKNHLKLLEAWSRLRAKESGLPQLVLVGNAYSGFEDLAEKVDRVCQEDERVVWLKGVSDEELERLYTRCRFTVFPSIAEGFGLPILESVWYGRPCLCANFGAMEEAAQGGGCLRVDMNRVEAIEDGIRSLTLDPDLVASLESECGRRKLRTWADYAAELGGILGIEDVAPVPAGPRSR